jgi:hypothetical protein
MEAYGIGKGGNLRRGKAALPKLHRRRHRAGLGIGAGSEPPAVTVQNVRELAAEVRLRR